MRVTAIAALALLAVLGGCETSGHVVPAGKDSYMVSSHVAGCISCAASVKSMETANAFCTNQGKVAIVRNTNSTTNGFGYEVGNTTIFSCVSETDPEYTRPSLRKDNGVTTIENR
jgi:predicted RNA-binding Zn-ribbon protein involved in translation (DUF1610 family)